jgi:hypothetical protein
MLKPYWHAKGLQGVFLARTPEVAAPLTGGAAFISV